MLSRPALLPPLTQSTPTALHDAVRNRNQTGPEENEQLSSSKQLGSSQHRSAQDLRVGRENRNNGRVPGKKMARSMINRRAPGAPVAAQHAGECHWSSVSSFSTSSSLPGCCPQPQPTKQAQLLNQPLPSLVGSLAVFHFRPNSLSTSVRDGRSKRMALSQAALAKLARDLKDLQANAIDGVKVGGSRPTASVGMCPRCS